ncbi:hypothetical protein I553_3598 [Mycobacterium xenopi 4042]|uniref:Uncharacterized protein n=1 Tax=Mycobacterium xenopi 4042 TaxID=1299334 RepID=X8DIG6_MYCXE|nr:hypothetical protein I553_3598 [Mycobacterium xenopi 4042]
MAHGSLLSQVNASRPPTRGQTVGCRCEAGTSAHPSPRRLVWQM